MNAPFQSITEGGAAGRGAEELPRLAAALPIPVSGANAADCEKAIETMRTTFRLVRSLVRDILDKLNENLPVTATVDFTDQMNLLIDIEGDLVGKLANAAEQV